MTATLIRRIVPGNRTKRPRRSPRTSPNLDIDEDDGGGHIIVRGTEKSTEVKHLDFIEAVMAYAEDVGWPKAREVFNDLEENGFPLEEISNMESRTFIATGDARKVLPTLPAGLAHASVSSPPYWRLRDYGVPGQLGQEASIAEYVENLCCVYDEVRRVLRDDGTCWVNLGDTYSNNASRSGKKGNGKQLAERMKTDLPHKSLSLAPFRFAIAMQDRGWIVRNVVIWHKPNGLPASVKDRFTVDFEYLFFFSKQPKYYFQQQTDPIKESSLARLLRGQSTHHKNYGGAPGQTPHSLQKRNDAYRNGTRPLPVCRNKRCVWPISTTGCSEEHFAVYPEELIETPILASCPEYGYVLDPFLGSGTTAIVCERLNRSCLGIELNPAFVKIAKNRIVTAGDKPERTSRKHQARLDGEIPSHIAIDCTHDDWIEE